MSEQQQVFATPEAAAATVEAIIKRRQAAEAAEGAGAGQTALTTETAFHSDDLDDFDDLEDLEDQADAAPDGVDQDGEDTKGASGTLFTLSDGSKGTYAQAKAEVEMARNGLEQATREAQSGAQMVSDLLGRLKAMMPADPDWAAIARQDPVGFRTRYQKWLSDRAVIAQAEQLSQVQAAAAHAKTIAEETAKLAQAAPELGSQDAVKTLLNKARRYGFSEQEVAGVADHRLLLLARDALAYRALQRQTRNRSGKPTKTLSPGAGQSGADRARAGLHGAKARLKRTGRLEDAARVIAHLL